MSAIGSKTISIKIPVNWLYGIVALAASLIAAFALLPEIWRPLLVFSAAVIGGAAGLTTAINNIDQRGATAAKAAEQAKELRVAATLDVLHRWNDPRFFECKRAGRDIRDFLRKNANVDAQYGYLTADVTRIANLVDILNRFEALNIAIENNIADDATAKKFFRTIVAEYWHLTEGVIKKLRAEQGNARLYKEFEALFQRWKD